MFATKSKIRPWHLSFWRAFWMKNGTEINEKSFWKRNQKSYDFSFNFFMILARFWTSWVSLGVHKKCTTNQILLSWMALGAQMAPRPPPRASGTPPNLDFNEFSLLFLIVSVSILCCFIRFLCNGCQDKCNVSCVFCAMDFAKARWREGRRQLDTPRQSQLAVACRRNCTSSQS